MRNISKAVALVAMLAFPMVSFAGQATPDTTKKTQATAPKAPKAEKAPATKKVATKSASGTVKSISDTSLVITKGKGKTAKEETFTVNATTAKKGTIEDGSKVSVRYTMDGSNMVATAITAAPAKAAKATKAPKAPKK